MTQSDLEASFLFQWRALGLPEPELEYRFCERRWRFDFALPERMLAVEVEGGTWAGGRHTRGKGFENDCRKYNRAAELGWYVYRFPTGMVESGEAIATMERVVRG